MLRSLLCGLSALTLSAAVCHAQVTQIPGSGCPTTSVVYSFGGQPQIGTQFAVKSGCTTAGDIPLMIVGVQTTNLTLFPPTVCGTAPCVISCLPLFVLQGAAGAGSVAFVLNIPNDPSLIGFCFCIQGSCASRTATGGICFDIGPAYQICITP